MSSKKFFDIPFVVPALVVGLALILCAFIGATSFYKVRTLDNVLSVTGSAKTQVTADSAKWTLNVNRTVYESALAQGHNQVAADVTAVKAFLTRNGVKENEIEISPIFVDQVYSYERNGGPREYTLRQNVVVQTKDIERISTMSKNIQDLTSRNVMVSPQSPEYYYSKLADLRVSLLSDAVKDAKARANEIAESNGQSVGSIKSASSGVVQVLSPNSIEVSDYGQYDTSTIEKDVMVTVRATFFVD